MTFLPVQGSSTAAILQEFGSGKLGSMMALTRLLFADTGLWIYGGFIRDAVVRGEVHNEMDLDVGVPPGINVDQGMSLVSARAKTLGMQFVKNRASTDPKLRTCFFRTAHASAEFEVQVCQLLLLLAVLAANKCSLLIGDLSLQTGCIC